LPPELEEVVALFHLSELTWAFDELPQFRISHPDFVPPPEWSSCGGGHIQN
jgi:hypothetical protein